MWGDYQVDDPNTLTQAQKDKLINQAKMIAGITAAFADTDVAVAADMAAETMEGGLSAGTTAYTIPKIDEYLKEQGFDKEVRDTALLALSAGIGATVGGDTASTANNVGQVQWNYLSHTELSAWKTSLIKCSGNQQCIDNVNTEYNNLNKINFNTFENYCTINFDAQRCHNLIKQFQDGTQGTYNLNHLTGLYNDISRLGGKDASSTINSVKGNNAFYGYRVRDTGINNINRHNGNKAQALIGEITNARDYGVGRSTIVGNSGYRVNVVNNTATSNKKDSEQSKGNSEMLGANGTQTFSTTVWKEKGSKARIDVENPNPGVRAGQIYYQDSNNKKYYYNPNNGKFYEGKVENGVLAPKSIQDLLKDKKFKDGIDKGLKYLG